MGELLINVSLERGLCQTVRSNDDAKIRVSVTVADRKLSDVEGLSVITLAINNHKLGLRFIYSHAEFQAVLF